MAKTFIVSGCASGIGQHMALALARAPAQHNVIMLDINGPALERMVQEHGLDRLPRIVARQHDVRDAAGWERIVRETVERQGVHIDRKSVV